MSMIHCAIAADHRGFLLKERLRLLEHIGSSKMLWHDCGTYTEARTDYPRYAHAAIEAFERKMVTHAVLLCGTGTGMAIAMNRHAHLYAAVVWSPVIARRAREDDNVNCLVLPADYLTYEEAFLCIESWLDARFKGGRYAERLAMLD